MKKYQTALVIGAGSFGTSIASILSQNFEKVILKVRSDEVFEDLKKGENNQYLPGIKLPNNIEGIKDWDELKDISKVEVVISGLPTAAIKEYFTDKNEIFEKFFEKDVPFISLSKGIDPVTLELADDLFFEIFPKYKDLFVFLSGPSFAREIMQEQITLVSGAGRSKFVLEKTAKMLECSFFKIFPTYDIKGVLLGGALKNVLAIASGITEGLGFTHNTNAALLTRGITEMLRFGIVFNARPETFYGLSGMGDLILTTSGHMSRNKLFGIEIAKGVDAQEGIKSSQGVVEGYKTTKATYLLAQKYGIRAPIFTGLYEVLYNGVDPLEVIRKLMKSPPSFNL
jgi:glycerol-3-phosphate dehydrogenase (NAD(P)+)